MRATLRWLCAGTLALSAVAMVGCEKKSDTTTTPGTTTSGTTSSGTSTTMESAKQSMNSATTQASDKAREMGAEMKQATTNAAEKTKEGAETAKDKTTQALDNLKK
jgi:hypothetical protein